MTGRPIPELRWAADDETVVVGDVTFHTTGTKEFESVRDLLAFVRRRSRSDEFVLLKSREDLARYEALARSLAPIERILELGIFQGGSTVFLAELLQPETLVALELEQDRVVALDEYCAARDPGGAIRAHYGVDQADADRLRSVVQSEFGGSPLDLVIDDASHFLDPTRSSFNTLFPLVREGGMYVIEDWSWAHAYNYFELDELPLTQLVFELVVACAHSRDIVSDLTVTWNAVWVKRGPAPVAESGFDVAAPYRAAGELLARAAADARRASPSDPASSR